MKRIISVAICGVVFFSICIMMNGVLKEKTINRYYILSHEVNKIENIDVQVYGSCHAYSSFDIPYFVEKTGLSSYNMSNPGEIMPATYLRMLERFEKDKPEVAVVEIWGVNAYETYDPSEDILGRYFQSNIEDIPFSVEKLEVIWDFETLSFWEENFPIIKYRTRLFDFSISKLDFDYSFKKACKMYNKDGKHDGLNEMENRFANGGFLKYEINALLDYREKQAYVENDDILEVEADLMEYVDKIISLCDEYDVRLIFYRAPYRSAANELRKTNFLRTYFAEKEIPFWDLEEEIDYDYQTDFRDYEHLSSVGARKSTEFLTEKIVEIIGD